MAILLLKLRNALIVWLCWCTHWMATLKADAFPAANAECDASLDSRKNDQRILKDEQIAAYREDGFIFMKGVLSNDLTDRMATAGRAIVDRAAKFPMFFSVIENGLIFNGGGGSGGGGGPSDEENQTSSIDATAIFRDVALYSNVPRIAAELMELDPNTQNLRLLRDIFLAKSVNATSNCDFHVDDHGFWPESYISEASNQSGKDQDGVNVWIALEDMPAVHRGSMALAAGSHKEPWRFEAYEAIGQNRSIDGGHTKEAIIEALEEKRKSGKVALGACEIGRVRPDLKEKMAAREVVFDIQRGDMIFHTRSLFHKTLEVTEEGKKYYDDLGLDILNRYSIRYTPGNAKLPKGWLAEWSAAADKDNPGKSLNEIVAKRADGKDFLWYPQVWPSTDADLDRRLDFVADTELDRVKQQVQAEITEIFAPKAVAAEQEKAAATE